MQVIGLTGGIACGKSTVSGVLRSLGVRIVDGDALSRALTAPNGPALPEIRRVFGDGVFEPGGTLDRSALGRLVFGHPEALGRLNDLMRPLLREAIFRAVDAARDDGEAFCVMDMPLLFEEGLNTLCSRVWCVIAPEEEQILRLRERNGLSRDEALARIRSQWPNEKKAALSDVVIDTDRPIEDTAALVRTLWEKELLFASGRSPVSPSAN